MGETDSLSIGVSQPLRKRADVPPTEGNRGSLTVDVDHGGRPAKWNTRVSDSYENAIDDEMLRLW
jgi:hypothetical protein